MFESLDSIDWEAIGPHIYSSVTDIPEQIWCLLSANLDEREKALAFLFGHGQDYGNVYGTTAHIIPFVLEVIAADTQPGRTLFLPPLEAITSSKVYTGGRRDYSIRQVRHYLNAYDALERGIPIYVKLLDEPDAELRAAAAAVLGGLNASVVSILPILRDHFATETDESTQIVLLEAIARLLSEQDYAGTELRKAYAPFFQQIIERASSSALRFAAAEAAITASVSLGFATTMREGEVSPTLSAALVEYYWSLPEHSLRIYEREKIVRLLALLPDPTPLIELANHPDTTPDEAHTIVRGLMSSLLPESQRQRYWRYLPVFKYLSEKKIYEIFPISQYLDFPKAHTGSNWAVLRAVVNADKFWVIPTNLLSVMFNLPDDRAHLREFIEQTDETIS